MVSRNLFGGGSRGGEAAGFFGSSVSAFPTTIEMVGFVGTERLFGSLKSTHGGMTSSIAFPLLPATEASPHLNNRAYLQWFWLSQREREISILLVMFEAIKMNVTNHTRPFPGKKRRFVVDTSRSDA